MVNLQNIQVKSGSNFTTVCPFPVGYIYMSSMNTSLASVFGGTWSADAAQPNLKVGGR